MKKFFTLLAVMMGTLGMSAQDGAWLIGDMAVWSYNQGEQFTTTDNVIYTLTTNITKGNKYWCIITKLCSSWDELAAYRYGCDNQVVELDTPTILGRNGNVDASPQTYFPEDAEYTFTFNIAIGMVTITKGNPFVEELPTEMFLIGTLQNWVPNAAVEMSADGYVFTYEGDFPASDDGSSWFSFVAKNGSSEEDWSINSFRYGPAESGFEITESMLGETIEASGRGDVSFKIAPGHYKVVFDVENKTLVVTGQGEFIDPVTGDMYILGDVEGLVGWFPNEGLMMDSEDGNEFTATITTLGLNVDEESGVGYSYFGFTSALGSDAENWDAITAYRLSPVSEGDFLVTDELLGQPIQMNEFGVNPGNAFKIVAGTWDLVLNVEEKKLTITKHGEQNYKTGDINGDDAVDVTDLSMLIDIVLGKLSANDPEVKGDIHLAGNEGVDVSDISILIDIVLGK